MKFKEIYDNFIKPLVDIISYYLINKMKFTNDVNMIISTVGKDDEVCGFIKQIFYYFLLFIYFIAILWIIIDIIMKNNYLFNSYLKRAFRSQILFADIPEFYQLKNIIYINDSISFDYHFIFFISVILIICGIYYYFNNNLRILFEDKFEKEFNLFIPFFIISLIIGFLFYAYNSYNIIVLSNKSNIITQMIYDNINKNFIENQKLCNYDEERKNSNDIDFVKGKCNDLKLHFTTSKLYYYLNDTINEMYSNSKSKKMTLEKFLTLKNNNDVLYKDLLISSFFTYTFMKYYVDNNLYDKAREIFSKPNLNTFFYKYRINPILDFNYDSILFNPSNDDLNFNNPLMKDAFGNNRDIYYYVYNEYYEICNNIQNNIVDVYNICNQKTICMYYYYLIIGIVMLIIVIYYFRITYMKLNK
jgi:hypothetical protein